MTLGMSFAFIGLSLAYALNYGAQIVFGSMMPMALFSADEILTPHGYVILSGVAVCLAGVTGARTSLPPGVKKFLRQVQGVSPVPVAVGFGVSQPKHAAQLAPVADGVITASALIDALGPDGTDIESMSQLARALRRSCERD